VNLQYAIRAGDLAAVSDLLRSGIEVNHPGPDGLTPLMVAAGLGQSQTVELLLTAGAQPLAIEPRMGATALHKAAQSGNADIICMLLAAGAFIDQQSPSLGNTALMDAVLQKQEEAVRQLLARGAKTTLRNHWQQTALELAYEDGLEVVARVIVGHEQALAATACAQPLMGAVKSGDVDEVRRLLAAGTDVNVRTPVVGGFDDDYTALGLAARDGHTEIAHVLLEAGADVRRSVGLMKGTAIHDAAYFGRADIIRRLTAKRDPPGSAAVIDAQGAYNGLTALHDAAWHLRYA
jgi:ankyrin repeat protein